MRLHGTTEENLRAAASSARRLRDHPVHADTLKHWVELVHHARRKLATTDPSRAESLGKLIADLEVEIAERRDGVE